MFADTTILTGFEFDFGNHDWAENLVGPVTVSYPTPNGQRVHVQFEGTASPSSILECVLPKFALFKRTGVCQASTDALFERVEFVHLINRCEPTTRPVGNDPDAIVLRLAFVHALLEKLSVLTFHTRLLAASYPPAQTVHPALLGEDISNALDRQGGSLEPWFSKEIFLPNARDDVGLFNWEQWWNEQFAMRLIGAFEVNDRNYAKEDNVFWVFRNDQYEPAPYDFDPSSIVRPNIVQERARFSGAVEFWKEVLAMQASSIEFWMIMDIFRMRAGQPSLRSPCQTDHTCDSDLLNALANFKNKKPIVEQQMQSTPPFNGVLEAGQKPPLDDASRTLVQEHIDTFFRVLEEKKFLLPMLVTDVAIENEDGDTVLCSAKKGALVRVIDTPEWAPNYLHVAVECDFQGVTGFVNRDAVYVPPTP